MSRPPNVALDLGEHRRRPTPASVRSAPTTIASPPELAQLGDELLGARRLVAVVDDDVRAGLRRSSARCRRRCRATIRSRGRSCRRANRARGGCHREAQSRLDPTNRCRAAAAVLRSSKHRVLGSMTREAHRGAHPDLEQYAWIGWLVLILVFLVDRDAHARFHVPHARVGSRRRSRRRPARRAVVGADHHRRRSSPRCCSSSCCGRRCSKRLRTRRRPDADQRRRARRPQRPRAVDRLRRRPGRSSSPTATPGPRASPSTAAARAAATAIASS